MTTELSEPAPSTTEGATVSMPQFTARSWHVINYAAAGYIVTEPMAPTPAQLPSHSSLPSDGFVPVKGAVMR